MLQNYKQKCAFCLLLCINFFATSTGFDAVINNVLWVRFLSGHSVYIKNYTVSLNGDMTHMKKQKT